MILRGPFQPLLFCDSVGPSRGVQSMIFSMSCRDTSCLSMAFSMGCRAIFAQVPGETSSRSFTDPGVCRVVSLTCSHPSLLSLTYCAVFFTLS